METWAYYLLALAGWLVLLFVVPPFLRNRRQKQMISTLSAGDQVFVLGGVIGKVTRLEGSIIEVEIAPKVRIRCLAGAVSRGLRR